MVSIKKSAFLLIEKPIFCLNTAKTWLLESYDQKIRLFLDRNPGMDVSVRSGDVHEVSSEGCREGYREIYSVELHQTGTTAGEYALPAVQSKLRELRRRLAPPALCHTLQIVIHNTQKRAPLKLLDISNLFMRGSVKLSTLIRLSTYLSDD